MNRSFEFSEKRARLLLLVLAMAAVSAKAAHAYIDPGTGSYFLQVLAAGLFAAVFAVGAFWRKIKAGIMGIIGRRDKQ